MTNYTPNSQNPGVPNLSVLKNWMPFTLKDAYAPRVPLRYIVGNLFEIPSVNIVFGSPGSLKSFLLADLACCVVAGIGWLPPLPNHNGNVQKTTQAPAVWLDFDNGKRRTHERFSAIGRTLKLPDNAPLRYYSMPSPSLNAGDNNQISELTQIMQFHGAKLAIIDNLGAISGGADENSAEMIKILSNIRSLSENAGAAVIVIHHPRKSSSSTGRRGDTLRGHSSIEAALDLALLVERETDSSEIKIQATKSRGVGVKSFGAVFTYQNDPAGELCEARFFADPKSIVTDEDTIKRAIIDCLGSGPLKKTELNNQVHQIFNAKVGFNRISALIDYLVANNFIINTGNSKSQILSCNPQKPL